MKNLSLVAILGLAGACGLMQAQNTSGVNLPQDKGPDKVDVSAYPPLPATMQGMALLPGGL